MATNLYFMENSYLYKAPIDVLPTWHEDAIGSVSTEWRQNHPGTLINKGRESHQL